MKSNTPNRRGLRSYKSLASFARYLKPYRKRMILIALLFVVSNILLSIIPVFIGKLLGDLTAQPLQRHDAILSVIILIVLSTGHDLIWHVCELAFTYLIYPLSYHYETRIFEQVIRRPYPYFIDKFTGKIASNISTLSQEFKALLDDLFFNYVSEVISLVAVSIILLSVNIYTGLVFVGLLTLMFVTAKYSIRNSTKFEKVATDLNSTKNGKVIDAVANFVNVKSFRTEGHEIRRLQQEQQIVITGARRSQLWLIVFWASMSFFIRNLIWPITIVLNVWLFLDHKLDIAQLTTFLSSILLFSDYIWEAIWNVSQINLRLSRVEEAYGYLFGAEEEELPVVSLERKAMKFTNSLAFKNLSFAYPDKPDEAVLKKMTLSIRAGEKIGIVGMSGGGKSTLTKILLGYYDVPEKMLLVDGTPTASQAVAELIAFVPQDTSLFHRSIADNIAYAATGIVGQPAIRAAAKKAYAHEFIVKMKDGYQSLVGERGVKLSAGQRQRIAIARAFLDNKPILVMDEATSALDSESEALVQKALEKLWHNKTVIAIAHRLSTLQNMDRIIVLDHGQIAEQGSHKELLEQNGIYAKLWAHQSGGFIEE